MERDDILRDLNVRAGRAVAHYWETRTNQRDKQQQTGKADQGLRSAVTGGAQMDGFIDLFTELIAAAGISQQDIFRSKDVELPGFFRPTKEWDLLVVRENVLLVAIEAKSQVGPSFGNNFNNRTEEAMGSALDLWTAYREHAYLASPQPFLGYFFMLEDCEASQTTRQGAGNRISRSSPNSSAHRTAAGTNSSAGSSFLNGTTRPPPLSPQTATGGSKGVFATPADDLSVDRFARVLVGHLAAFV